MGKLENIANNIMNQITSIFSSCNEKSLSTRHTYLDKMDNFAKFLAEEYKTQKFANVRNEHVIEYVKYRQDQGVAPSTIKGDLTAIRFFHEKSDSKNKIMDNQGINEKLKSEDRELGKRQVGGIDRSWTDSEFNAMKEKALGLDREKTALMLEVARNFGCRETEILRLDVKDIKDAIDNGRLEVTGKGGYTRDIPTWNDKMKETLVKVNAYISDNGLNGKVFVHDREKYHEVKKEFQNFIYNHREEIQDKDRVSNLEARALQTKDIVPKANLTGHGLRHSYIQDRVLNLWEKYSHIEDKRLRADKIMGIITEEVGHHRKDVVRIYAGALLDELVENG